MLLDTISTQACMTPQITVEGTHYNVHCQNVIAACHYNQSGNLLATSHTSSDSMSPPARKLMGHASEITVVNKWTFSLEHFYLQCCNNI